MQVITTNIETLQSDYPLPSVPKKAKEIPLMLRLVRLGFATVGRLAPQAAGKIAYRLFTTPRHRARHRQSDAILEEAKVSEFMYGKHLLKTYEWGSGDRTILLVHGWESRGTALRSFVPGLVAQGYRVLAFDGPAHGDSGGKQTNLMHFGGAIRAIIKRVGKVYGIITHSFGGASTVFTLANIDNSIKLEKLVLIGVPASMERVHRNFTQTAQLPPQVSRAFKKELERRVNMPLAEADVSKSFTKTRIGSTLIIHDKEDQVVDFRSAESVLDNWENTTLVATKGYGHFLLMKNPDVIKRVVQFFK